MHFNGVGSVFEVIASLYGIERKLARLASQHKSRIEIIGHRGPKNEPARLGSDVDVRSFRNGGAHLIDGFFKRLGIVEQRGDILKRDSRPWKIFDHADFIFQIHTVHLKKVQTER
jgi:hypothetical protein